MTRHTAKGFSLVEVTVAVGITALMIVSVALLLQRLPISGREVRDQDLALKIAREEIEILRAEGYAALPTTGPFTHALLTSLASSSAALTVANYNDETKEITATVSWVGTAGTRTLPLTTLIAEESGLP